MARTGTNQPALLERSVELEALSLAVRALSQRHGGVVCINAAAGMGKTALVERVVQDATDAGCLVRTAAPGPLERHFAYGVLRALFEQPLREAPAQERARLLDGAAGRAGDLLLAAWVPGADAGMMVAHSVLWLCVALADERPLALVIDDAQWADSSSLETIVYLSRRIADVPLLIILAARSEDPDAAAGLLSLIGDAAGADTLNLEPLTADASVQLVRRLAPGTAMDVCLQCHQAAHGNPWLLGELSRQIVDRGPEAVTGGGDDPQPVSDMARGVVRGRVAALIARDRSVLNALAVLRDAAPASVVAAVAGTLITDLGPARDALVAAGLLERGGTDFAHDLIATAVYDSLPRHERESLHRDAARELLRASADLDLVASHLLRAAPQADAETTSILCAAATAAQECGAPATAIAYLQRALDERAEGDARGDMLAQLAAISFDAGFPDARDRLREALEEATVPASRLEVLTRLSALHVMDVGDTGIADLLDAERAAAPDDNTRMALEAAALDTLLILPDRHEERAQRARATHLGSADDPLLRGALLMHRAWLGTELGDPDATVCAAMAREALAGGLLLREAHWRVWFHLCTRILIFTDRLDEAQQAIDSLHDEAEARGSLRLRAVTAWFCAQLAVRRGRFAEAENEARLVLDLLGADLNMVTGGATEILLTAQAARGAFDEAHELLEQWRFDGDIGENIWETGSLHARAQLRLAEGDFERAYADARATATLRDRQGRPNPTWNSPRATAALALAHIGRLEEAAGLADTELARAERYGAPVPIITALHARIVAEPDNDARLALCERALAVAAGAAVPLDTVNVQLELGATLARKGRRIEARGALQAALAAADSAGGVLLAERARRELVATGLRPRRAQTDGAAALTPRQRQVCELAAEGVPNRRIAQQLFLSIKTVETHLATSYRKLGVDSRDGVAAALAAAR